MLQIIEQIEQQSLQFKPQIELYYLKHVDSTSLVDMINSVYAAAFRPSGNGDDYAPVGRHGTLKTTLITIGVIALMLFSLYRRLTTVFLVIFTVMIELTASRGVVAVLANAGIIELSTYSTNLLTLAGHRRRNRLRDLHSRPLSRSALRRAGSRFGVQHDVPRDRAHHLGFGPDDCRRGVLSDLHPAPVFPEPGHSRRYRRRSSRWWRR